jgi:hypothetical protein
MLCILGGSCAIRACGSSILEARGALSAGLREKRENVSVRPTKLREDRLRRAGWIR